MPRSGPAFPPELKAIAVAQYLAGKATMPAIARELGTTPATISRWVKDARQRGLPAWHPEAPPEILPTSLDGGRTITPLTLASRVAALAPPPAPAEEPLPELGDGTAGLIDALRRDYREHLEVARKQGKLGDPKGATAARSAAVKALTEIRQLQAAARKEGGDALALTRDDIAAAELEIRRRLDEIAAAKGETLMWTLDGTPDVTPRISVTHDAGNKSGAGA